MTTVTPRTFARAEVVGSLLLPPALKAAVEAFYAPGHSAVLAERREGDFQQGPRPDDVRQSSRRPDWEKRQQRPRPDPTQSEPEDPPEDPPPPPPDKDG